MSLCRIIDEIIEGNRLTLKILWALIIMVSSLCMGAGIRGVIYEVSDINMLLLAFGLIGTFGAVVVYLFKIVFNSPLP